MKQILCLSMIFFLLGTIQAQSRRDKKLQRQQEIREMIEGRHFRFSANSMTPLGDNVVMLSGPYELIVDSFHIKAFLPYYGRVYLPQFGGMDGGVKFEKDAESVVVQWDKIRRRYEVRAFVNGDKDTYRLSLSCGLNGYASLIITFVNRQSISYRGTIEKME